MPDPVEQRPSVVELVETLVRDVPDFPQPGVVFKDIAPLLADADAFGAVVRELAAAGADEEGEPLVGSVLGIEARGFILAAPVALALGAGFVPVRKAGKLPGRTHRVAYALEYGEAELEIPRDAIRPGDRVLLVDDVLATGGTLAAARSLVEAAGGVVVQAAVLLELSLLNGRSALDGLPVSAVQVV